MKVSNNKILITGATAGIGKALLEIFLQADNQIIAVGRNQEKLAELGQLDKRIIPFQCDIAKEADLDRLMLFLENEHRDLNILINNAGIQYNYHFTKEAHLLSKIEQEINVNFTAPLKLIALTLSLIHI